MIQVLLRHKKLDTTAIYTRVALKTLGAVKSPLTHLKPPPAVRFRWKDYRTADASTGAVQIKTMSFSPAEFLRRLVLHVLPTGFHRIRHYGLMAKGPRAPDLEALRALIAARAGAPAPLVDREAEPAATEPTALSACRCCGGPDTTAPAPPSPLGRGAGPAARVTIGAAKPAGRALARRSARGVTARDDSGHAAAHARAPT